MRHASPLVLISLLAACSPASSPPGEDVDEAGPTPAASTKMLAVQTLNPLGPVWTASVQREAGPRFALHPDGSVYNARAHLEAVFLDGGAEFRLPGAPVLGMIWREGDSPVAGIDGNQAHYEHAGVEESWVNGPLGLEHVFVVDHGDAELTLNIDLLGGWTAEGEGTAVSLHNGVHRLAYSGLYAHDATGRALPANMVAEGDAIRIDVRAADAVWPVTVDPLLAVETKWLGTDIEAKDLFGISVGLDGTTAVVGAPSADIDVYRSAGRVFVFEDDGSGWTESAILEPPTPSTSDGCGTSVAISGDIVLAGCPGNDEKGNSAGAVHVYSRATGSWEYSSRVLASDGEEKDRFGSYVAVNGTTAVVSSVVNDGEGSGYAFERIGDTWVEQGVLFGAEAKTGDQVGASLTVEGDIIVLGAPRHAVGSETAAGAAFVFRRTGVTWNQVQRLLDPEPRKNEYFGTSVSLSGGTLALGVPRGNDAGTQSGTIHIYEPSGLTWALDTSLTAENGMNGDMLGSSVDLDGDVLIAGASDADDVAQNAGKAYIFNRRGGLWQEAASLTTSDGEQSERLGSTVAVSGYWPVAGSSRNAELGASAGAAYLFELPPIPTADNSGRLSGLDWLATYSGTPKVSVAPDGFVDDWDSDVVQSVTVSLGPNPDGSSEMLSVDTSGVSGISSSYDSASGVLTVTGPGNEADMSTVIRTLTYDNTATTPDESDRMLTVVANDGTNDSPPATTTLTYASNNIAPALDLSGPVPIGTDFRDVYDPTSGSTAGAALSATVTDPDNSEMVSMTITVTNLLDGVNEELFVDTTGTDLVATGGPSGLLTVTGVALIEDYEKVLHTLTYSNTAASPVQTTRILDITVSDGTDSVTENTIITYAINDVAPTLNLDPSSGPNFTAAFVEDAGAVPITASDVDLFDPDNTQLDRITIDIDAPLDGASEGFEVDTTGTFITTTYDTTLGTLTLIGPDTAENFEAVLANTGYINNSDDPDQTDRTITFVASDGTLQSTPVSTVVSVTSANDAPYIDLNGSAFAGLDYEFTYTEDSGPLPALDGQALVIDVDDTTLQSLEIVIAGYANGTAEQIDIDASGTAVTASYDGAGKMMLTGPADVGDFQIALQTLTYTNNANRLIGPSRTLQMTATDGKATSAVSNTFIDFISLNDDPVVNFSSSSMVYVEASGPVPIDPSIIFQEPDGGTVDGAVLEIVMTEVRSADSLSILDVGVGPGEVSVAGDTIGYGGTAVATFTGTGTESDPMVITFNAAGSVPAVRAVMQSVAFENTNDDPDVDPPRTVSFTYDDGQGGALTIGSIDIIIQPINNPPVFVAPTPTGTITGNEASKLQLQLLADDPDSSLVYSMDPLPDNAVLSSLTGQFSWTPTFDQVGTHAITASVTDGTSSDSRELTFVIGSRDSDGDGIPDGDENALGLDEDSTDSDGDGIPDDVELGGSITTPNDTDGDGIIDALDDDSDGDGIPDLEEEGDGLATTPPVDFDGDGIPDYLDTDADADGVEDDVDNCGLLDNPGQEDQDGDNVGDPCDDDRDGDGIDNLVEESVGMDPDGLDSDGDTISDAEEGAGDLDGDGIADGLDDDTDNDGIPDSVEAGDSDIDTPPVNTDGDDRPDYRDIDSDADSVADNADNCVLVPNEDQLDADDNGQGDLCDNDIDGDGVPNDEDSCPMISDDGTDSDGDGQGDVCDGDRDADLVANENDNCPDVANTDQVDKDKDEIGDACDPDVGCSCEVASMPPGAAWLLLLPPLLLRRRRGDSGRLD